MTTNEAVAMYRNALAHGETPAEAAALVDGAIGGYAGRKAMDAGTTEQRLQVLEENVAWVIRNMARLTDAVMRLNEVGKRIEERQKEVEGEI